MVLNMKANLINVEGKTKTGKTLLGILRLIQMEQIFKTKINNKGKFDRYCYENNITGDMNSVLPKFRGVFVCESHEHV
jgi:uncharacterized protein (AIM24 family)